MIRFLLLLAFAGLYQLVDSSAAEAQTRIPDSQFVIEHWDANDGLPVNNVLKLHQSSDGYLWMVSLDGLVRFDGMQFKVYQTVGYPELPTNRFTKLYEGRDGSLWIVSEQKYLIRFINNEFTHIRNADGLNGQLVQEMHLDDNGHLWFGTESGISMFDGVKLSPYQPEHINGSIDRIFVEENGAVWYRNQDTLENFRFENEESTYYFTSPNSFHFNPVIEERNGRIWFSSLENIYRYEDDSLTTCCTVEEFTENEAYKLLLDNATSVTSTDQLNFSYITDIGRYYTPKEGEINSLMIQPFNAGSAGSTWSFTRKRIKYNSNTVLTTKNDISSTLFDREGNLWVATSSDGLYLIKENPFTAWSLEEGLPGKNIYPVLEDKSGTIWTGTYGEGIGRIKDGIAESVPGFSGVVLSLHEISDGTLLTGLHYGGYHAWEATTNRFIHQTEPADASDASVYAIFEQENGDLWLGTNKGLFLRRNSEWTQFDGDSGFTDSIVRFFLEAPDGALWMATNGSGLARYKEGTFDLLGTEQGFGSDLIRSLFIEQNSDPGKYTLWVGSQDRGLFRVKTVEGKPDLQTITQYSPAGGMLDYVIHVILMDDNDNFWFNTNRGVFTVEKEELEAFHKGDISSISGIAYTENDGLRNREGNGGVQPAGIRASDGTFWLPGQDGVTRIDPESITANNVVPPVKIEELTTLKNSHQLSGTDPIQLSAGERDFEFKFSSLSFVEPAKNRFRYRLKGYSNDWIDAGSRRITSYTNIPAGDYTFEVMGSNNTGTWNPEPASIQLTIAPYFYETKWFALFLILLTGILIYGGVRLRVRKLEKNEQTLLKLVNERTGQLRKEKEKTQQQADKLKELDRAKTRFFTNMSHEFRTPLTLIMGPLQRSLSHSPEHFTPPNRNELVRMLRNSRRLLRLMDQTLELTKLEHGKLKLKVHKLDLNTFISDLTELFLPLCEENGIELTFREIPAGTALYADPYKLDKIIGNLLSNAIKFTPIGGSITIDIHEKNDHVAINVADTGIGIPGEDREKIFDRFYQVDSSETRAHEGSGIGLSLAREFAALHRGSLMVDSALGKGTTFTLTLKKGSAHFTEEELQARTESRPLKVVEKNGKQRNERIEHPEKRADTKPKVLVVEDNPDVRSFIREELMGKFDVVEASNGKHALREVEKELPDLIIADIMMPEMDGITFNRQLKKEPATASIPLIFLTAKSARDSRLEGLDEGADDYITKPFDPALLKARVRNLIDSRLRLRHLIQADNPKSDQNVEGLSFLSVNDSDSFIREVACVLEKHFSDPEFQVSTLAKSLHLSRSYMARKIKKAIGMTPGEVIKTYRMEKASTLLKENSGNITEVAYAVGFNSLSYFSHTFKEHFGKTPSEFLEEKAGIDSES